jgi:hypothetical protein
MSGDRRTVDVGKMGAGLSQSRLMVSAVAKA